MIDSVTHVTYLVAMLVAQAGAMGPGYDHSAYRVDAEVIGWSNDLSQMAVVASTQRRSPGGGVSGQVMVVVFPTDSIRPLQNIEVGVITLADHPHAPHKLDDARQQLKGVDTNTSKLWKRRPIRRRPAGGMRVEPLWESIDLGQETCQPAVGFILELGGELRYQPHQQLSDLRASCSVLRLTDVRTYWIAKDLGAALARFDYSPTRAEMSFRQPLPVSWRIARPLELRVRVHRALDGPGTKRLVAALKRYGKVELSFIEPPPGEELARGAEPPPARLTVQHVEGLRLLGERLGRELGGKRVLAPPETGDDLLVTLDLQR